MGSSDIRREDGSWSVAEEEGEGGAMGMGPEGSGLDRLREEGAREGYKYIDKIKKYREVTKQDTALLCGSGTISGLSAVAVCFNRKFGSGRFGPAENEHFLKAANFAIEKKVSLWIVIYQSSGIDVHSGVMGLVGMTKSVIALDEIKKAVMDGLLKPGDPLPSIRQLANDLELNHNTVAKAYRILERDSVIQTKGYRGTSIHGDAKQNSTVDMNDSITIKLNETIKSLRESGATDSEIRFAFSNVMKNQ